MDSILERMHQHYENFTKSEKKIADYVFDHKKEAQYISISDLSSACGVAVSTVSLFCRKIDLDGFNDFKLELAKATMPVVGVPSVGSATGEICESDSMEQVFEKTFNVSQNSLFQTYKLLNRDAIKKAVQLLADAGSVLCLGKGNHSIVASAAWSKFATVSSKFKTIEDSDFQTIGASTLASNDVVLFFSYSGSTHEFLDLAKVAKARNAKIILVTRFAKSPGAALSDCVLLCGTDEEPLLFGSIAAIVAQLYVIDVLFNSYFRLNFEENEKTRESIAKALAHKVI
ncbi:MAG: MurR/RpiR family transcriptional regulator [Clostridia bacterium]|nr:MurR/RpiR family transcriptional regulator [Clostridia bacterium]